MNSEDNIRPPDEAITERLVDNNINIQFNDKDTYNDELNLVLELSKNEYNFSQEFEEQKEIDTIIQQSKTELEKLLVDEATEATSTGTKGKSKPAVNYGIQDKQYFEEEPGL